MKPITKKLLEAGLINESFVKMLEKWGSLDHEEVELVRTFRSGLKELVNDLDALLEPSEDIKETKFELIIKEPPTNLWTSNNGTFSAVKDELGRYVVGPRVKLMVGDFIWAPRDDGRSPSLRVLNFERIYNGDEVIAQQITVEPYTWD